MEMNINFKRFRIFGNTFRVLKVKARPNPSKFQLIQVEKENSENSKPFDMALPFRIRNPKRNFQILQDENGKELTKEESLALIRKDKLNAFE